MAVTVRPRAMLVGVARLEILVEPSVPALLDAHGFLLVPLHVYTLAIRAHDARAHRHFVTAGSRIWCSTSGQGNGLLEDGMIADLVGRG